MVNYHYDAYGVLLQTGGTMATTLGALNPLTYRGYVYDHETGLYYLQSRYYNPTIRQFISADAYLSTGQGFLFNPLGLTKVSRKGTKNGMLISWMNSITNTEVFRWDENPKYSNGPHYHIYSKGHYKPGDEVPFPYNIFYFPLG